MNINKCKTCKHYNSFFDSCNLFVQEAYLGEGEWSEEPVSIKRIDKSECEYEEVRE